MKKEESSEETVIIDALATLMATGRAEEAFNILTLCVSAFAGTVVDVGKAHRYTEITGEPIPTEKSMIKTLASAAIDHAEARQLLEAEAQGTEQ